MAKIKSIECEWLKYPEVTPISSSREKKVFYHAQLDEGYMGGTAQKCWYSNGIWLCDIFQSSVKVKLFRPCARNAKADIRIGEDGEIK